MTIGIMEVLLVNARGLKNTEFLGKIDPFVLIQYKDQEKKSSVARGKGGNPVWNETFKFRVEYPGAGVDVDQQDHYKLKLKIMDKDTFSADDFLGEATIYLEELLARGVEKGSAQVHPRKYSIVYSDQTYCGEIEVGITFTPRPREEEEVGDEDFGGWKESDY